MRLLLVAVGLVAGVSSAVAQTSPAKSGASKEQRRLLNEEISTKALVDREMTLTEFLEALNDGLKAKGKSSIRFQTHLEAINYEAPDAEQVTKKFKLEKLPPNLTVASSLERAFAALGNPRLCWFVRNGIVDVGPQFFSERTTTPRRRAMEVRRKLERAACATSFRGVQCNAQASCEVSGWKDKHLAPGLVGSVRTASAEFGS